MSPRRRACVDKASLSKRKRIHYVAKQYDYDGNGSIDEEIDVIGSLQVNPGRDNAEYRDKNRGV